MQLDWTKTKLFRDHTQLGGFQLSASGVAIDPSHTQVIREWPLPKTLADVRTFLGICGYYRKYIPSYARLAKPLLDLINDQEEDAPMEMDVKQESTFHLLRDQLTRPPILTTPRWGSDDTFLLDTAWSQEPGAIGGVLSQIQDGKERVIAYGSRLLAKGEQNYSSNKGEMLAVVHFLEYWDHYLLGRKFLLRTDHQALQWIRTMDAPEGMITRWLKI